MQNVRFAKVCESDLIALFGIGAEKIKAWVSAGCPRNYDGSFTLSKVCRWLVSQHKQAERRKVQLARIAQRDLIALTGMSRQTLFLWTKKHNLPRNADASYNLAEVIRWFPKYYDRIHRERYRKAARQIRELAELFKERKNGKSKKENQRKKDF